MARKFDKSEKLFEVANQQIPGGVNSPVRAFGSVGGIPFFVDQGDGPYLHDLDGNRYVDYVMSWGPLILGHAEPAVVATVKEAAARGTSFGVPTLAEVNLAALVRERMPVVEKLRLVSSGTEACMTATRLARAATGRDLIVKFDGGYHGHSDHFLVEAGSGLATGSLPASSGVPASITQATISLPYNDVDAVKKCFQTQGNEIAAIIVEPVAANMGVVPPAEGFLQTLRSITSRHQALLVFDEVITGFRVAPGGACELYGITPDLVCLGKILGGGLPIGGVGGRRDIMDLLAPVGPVYQAGTLSGNPLSTAAGMTTLRALANHDCYDKLTAYASDLSAQLAGAAAEAGAPVTINRVQSLFTLFFGKVEVSDFESAKRCDMARYSEFFSHMLDRNIFLPPSGFEAWFVSLSHTGQQLAETVSAARSFFESQK